MQSKAFTSQRGMIEIIAIVVVLALAAVGGAFYLSQTSKNKVSQGVGAAASDRRISLATPPTDVSQSYSQPTPADFSSPAPEIVASPTPTDPFAGWKTYSKDTSGYTFKYPQSWTTASVEGCGPAFYLDTSQKVWMTVCGLYTGSNESTADMATASLGSNLSSLVSRNGTVVGGHTAIDQQVKMSSEQISEEVYVADVKARGGSKGTLAIYLYIQDLNKAEASKETFGKVLQTFKFNY